MPQRTSAGLLLYRWRAGEPEMLLVHPGGPFWARKDERSWSIPKGLFEAAKTPSRQPCASSRKKRGWR